MLVAQVVAVFAVGMPFVGAPPGSAALVGPRAMQPPEGVRFVLAPEAKSVWLVNDKGYLTREFGAAEDVAAWMAGASLPLTYTAPDPRKTVVPVPIVKSPGSWLDVVALGMAFAAHERKPDATSEKGLLVLFLSSYGPADHLYAERLSSVSKLATGAGISVIGLFSGKAETRASVAQFVARHTFEFACAIDPGNAYADAFRATRTPEAFLLDNKMRVLYAGAIDDNTFGTEQAIPYLRNAINQFASGAKVTTRPTRVFGTPIDR
jgi:hypothetical protein